MTPSSIPVQVKNVTKRFHQGDTTVQAIHDVSLQIHAAEFVAIMGASGSGKSTLLHVIAGLTALDAGQVIVDGTDLSSMSDGQLTRFRRRNIGLVFQSFNLIPSLSAKDNIALPLMSDRRPQDMHERIDSLAERLGISGRKSHRPDALSGGEQQRVAIARALITNPAVVLADEPTGSLDSVTGQSICKLMQELCKELRKTIVMVTHEPAVAQWADRVIVMRDGEILTQFATKDFSSSQLLAGHYQEIVNVTPTL